ncbi:MAG: metallophosphoesterase [Deltaproteobacteria bacterium]|nr:metallophosphoesterase [Deltaproteobacteria bacterium]
METVIASDLHLADAERVDPRRPLWMAYKQRRFFVDDDFLRLLDYLETHAEEQIELVLAGDVFDFDSIARLPARPPGHVDWLARRRGLGSEEWMSLFKLECIIADHPRFFERLGEFAQRGGRVVVIIGNHDVELCWPSVQRRIREAMGLPARSLGTRSLAEHRAIAAAGAAGAPGAAEVLAPASSDRREPLVFCSWFYLSGKDTFVSHGHQYDPNCVCRDPIDPLIAMRRRPQVRIPFGDLATRYLLGGMGYFNPHATENFIMTARQYVRFFFKHMLRTQPLLLWSWLWGAVVTFAITLWTHWRPTMRDPLLVEEKVQAVAWRSGVTPPVVRRLHALSVPSAANNPLAILRELWLDRALLLLAAIYGAWQIVVHVNIAVPISMLWVLVPLGLLLPPIFVYAASVRPTVFRQPLLTRERAALIATITGVRRVVFGHTHVPERRQVGPVEYVNAGFWSPAFAEPECQRRIGTQTFVWIRAGGPCGERRAGLWEWPPGATEPRPYGPAADPQAPAPPARDEAPLRAA